MRNRFLIAFLILLPFFGNAQSDSIFTSYRDNVVWYTDLGFNTAPFSIKYDFPQNIKKVKYRNNYKAVLGFGVAYKWFALRIGFDLPGTIRPMSKYGNTSYFDIGTDFTIKKTMIDIDFHNYKGYAIKNAYRWNDSLSKSQPNDIRPTTEAASFSINVWYFHNKAFKMQGVRMKTASYKRNVKTWYLRSTINIHGAGNGQNFLIPEELRDSTEDKTAVYGISAFDLGVIPGIGYVGKHKNWQYAIMAGLAPVIQTKVFSGANTRTFLGLAPRYDLRLYGGYTVDKYFVLLSAEFDNKSIGYGSLKFKQSYYFLKLIAGIRIDRKNKVDRKK